MKYESVIGLEVHVELKTKTKIFCGCSTEFGAEPNTHVCPICLGLPGVLPVLNKEVLHFAIKAGLALHCDILPFSKFDRKNYYYPDLPKNFQTSQFDLPICKGGYVDIEVNGEARRIHLTRIHMEEDAGKLVHSGATIDTSDSTCVDYNRTGVPLLEIVGEPELRSGEEARAYLEKLRAVLQYLGVSDCRLEEGSMRCDANISVRPVGSTTLGTKTEIKNINSFSGVQKGIEYEAVRQAQILDEGGTIQQATRGWEEAKGITVLQRIKEGDSDYRYFPEPDLIPIEVAPAYIEEVRGELPEMPDARRKRFMEELGLPEYDANLLTLEKQTADYFEAVVRDGADAKTASNWMLGEFAKKLNEEGLRADQAPVQPDRLAELLGLIAKGTISGKIAKTVLPEMWSSGKTAAAVVKEKGLVQITDTGALEEIVKKIIAANPQSVADYRAGKKKAIGFLVGQIMKETKGRANPGAVNELLTKNLQ
ncbi:glutamyl-tRNA amidotransferase [Megasphaera cerevisiae DSM 20462]|jgi:aspartyl-tRNA(Asn)/glutamyl-tRNA(Gln) amidotransferase subunit B|uniref:Aspartyl/glutamyl-tRNA(Asn/Gln) amidotransferase subunit B n=1 Tax=Megasphaera cerevisiae DSM 20462 TaxID=1122219 RepID=A0A0J6WUD2_9FIRM|nr:Asp-tRNA(Asn)/Glu-tRNA(Gln) amidotransferase subunit GatB [Megasphaera cerevisiae]KMO85382.1 glutamyl-tRNA amidotransferase [Megasphaera cerevisiae DSM 20462]OKY52591.1 aspartyl/glutamyl-tRNA amidotransferase subunit B [Megasphaera cerevisiae]SJZ56965.1 aspartyl/glutamyl-tRNA(Asn/Gln) amidotransferase subunit B [Megasphaera cerevisiae DSM 20462]